MRSKLSIMVFLFTTFTIFVFTFLNFSQGTSTFRGIQNANPANQKKNSRSTIKNRKDDLDNERSLANEKNVEELITRRLQDEGTGNNTPIIVDNSTIPDASSTNSTDNSTNTTNTTTPAPSTPTIPDSYLFSVNPTQVYHSVKISGALNYGISKIIAAGVRQKNIVPSPLDYNVTKFISTTYRKYSDHSVYMFKTKLANSNLKRVNANFTVYYNYTNKVYSLIWYSYHSFNYTRDELYTNVTSNATNSTNNGTNSTNGTDISTNSTDNSTQTQPGRILMSLVDIRNDNQTLNALLYGMRCLVKTAIVQRQIPSDSNTFNFNNLSNASYLIQSNGVRYWFYTTLLEDYGYLSIEANFTVFYNNITQKYRLVAYSYKSSNISIGDNGDSSSGDNGDNGGNSDGSDVPGESDSDDGSTPIDNGNTGGDNQTNTDTNSTDTPNPSDNSTLPIDPSTNSTDPNSPSNSTNSTEPIDPSNPNGSDNSTNTPDPNGNNNSTDNPSTGGDNEEVTFPTEPEDGGSETPVEEPSDDSSDYPDESESNGGSKGTGIKISADVKTEEKDGEFEIKVHIEFGKDGSVKKRY